MWHVRYVMCITRAEGKGRGGGWRLPRFLITFICSSRHFYVMDSSRWLTVAGVKKTIGRCSMAVGDRGQTLKQYSTISEYFIVLRLNRKINLPSWEMTTLVYCMRIVEISAVLILLRYCLGRIFSFLHMFHTNLDSHSETAKIIIVIQILDTDRNPDHPQNVMD